MPLETATYLSDLNSSNPANTDSLSQADSHLRLIKSSLKNTFPNISGAVTATQTELNRVSAMTSLGVTLTQAPDVPSLQSLLGINTVTGSPSLPLTGGTLTGNLFLNGNPSSANQAANKAYVDSAVSAVSAGAGSYLTTTSGDSRYLKLTGGSVSGTLFANFQGTSHNFTSDTAFYYDGYVNCAIANSVKWYTSSTAFVVQTDAQKPGGGSWSASSDERLKDDVKDYEKGLEDLEELLPVTFKYNESSGIRDGKTYVGLIAQEVQDTTFRNMVYTDKDTGYLRVDASELVYALVNAVKELKARVASLEEALAE